MPGGPPSSPDPAAAAIDAGSTPGAFTGAPAFVSMRGPGTRHDEHRIGNEGDGDPAGRGCLSSGCHDGDEGPRFFAGGTVFLDVAGTTPASGVEVRIRDGAGNAVSAFTDERGNFFVRWEDRDATTLPARTGARGGGATWLMSGETPHGDCNSSACHGGAAGPIHL